MRSAGWGARRQLQGSSSSQILLLGSWECRKGDCHRSSGWGGLVGMGGAQILKSPRSNLQGILVAATWRRGSSGKSLPL